MTTERKKGKFRIIKRVYLGFSVLDPREVEMYEFWHSYIKKKKKRFIKQNYVRLTQIALSFMSNMIDTVSFIINIKFEDFIKDTLKDFKERFDTSN